MASFRKAERKQVKLKIGISAPSGAGKTMSALRIGFGICGDWNKIALVDTENGSGELYSDMGDYSVCPIEPPFTVEKYIDAIHEAEKEGFEVLIIDSLSHVWSGDGGLLDMQSKIAKNSKSGNSYVAWREVTPEYNKLLDTILQSPLDIIATFRAKSEYATTEENGKKTIRKLGLAPIFRDGVDFELTVFFEMSQDHMANATKDRTGMFGANDYFLPTEETGKMLNEWRNGGAQYKCAVCGKTMAQKLYNQTMTAYGVALCSKECKEKHEKSILTEGATE